MRAYDRFRVEILSGDLLLYCSENWEYTKLVHLTSMDILAGYSALYEKYRTIDEEGVECKCCTRLITPRSCESGLKCKCYSHLITLGSYENYTNALGFTAGVKSLKKYLQMNLRGRAIDSSVLGGRGLDYGDYGLWIKIERAKGGVGVGRGVVIGDNVVYTKHCKRKKGLFFGIRDERILSSQFHATEYRELMGCIDELWS